MYKERKKILIIDDDDDFRQGLADFLQSEGYLVREAADGQEGYESVMTSKPDLAIIDIAMPKYTGLELIEMIRKHNEHLPIMIITSKSKLYDDFTVVTQNIAEYIVKPIDLSEVSQKIKKIFASMEKSSEDKPEQEN